MGATEPGIAGDRSAGAPPDAEADRRTSARNALKITAALGTTLTISFFVRVLIPRSLGPEGFGDFSFSEAFTTTVFVALSLGLDTFIYREVSRRPERASDFWGGTLVLRLAISAALAGVVALFLHASGRSADVRSLVWLFAGVQLLTVVGATFQTLLHARATVDGLSLTSVGAKLVWAAGVASAAALRAPAWAFVLPSLVSEGLRATVLWLLARRNLGLRFRVNVAETRRVVVESAPFYFNAIAVAVMQKLDVSILALRAPSSEVGFYGVAVTVSSIALLGVPVLGSVLFPFLSRAAARSTDELDRLQAGILELTVAGSVPVALALSLGAEPIVRLLFGAAFAPAAPALAILAPMLVLTYANVVWAISLNVLGRGWSTAMATVGGIAVDAALNLGLLPTAMAFLGRPGSGGVACSVFMVVSEATVVCLFVRARGRRAALSSAVLSRFARTAGAAAIAVVTHLALAPLGPLRLVAAGVAYLAAAFALGALRRSDFDAAYALFGRRRGAARIT